MKKIFLLLTVLVGTMTAYADEYTYLTFETADGARASIGVKDLTLTISKTILIIGSQSFTLSNLSKMYFSTSDETTTGIEEITAATLEEATDIYNLRGNKVSKDQMQKGVYIVKTKNKTYKMIVK